MNAQNGNVGTVDSAAHVQAAGQRDPHMSGKPHLSEILVQFIHDRLNDTGRVDRSGMAMKPSLGMNDVGQARPGASARKLGRTAGEFSFFQIRHQRFQFRFVIDHELDVVSGRPTDVAVTVLVGNVADLANMGNAHQPSAAHAYGEHLVSRLGDVHQHARLKDFVVQPLSKILLDDGRQKLFIISRADIGDSVLHWIAWIVTHF